MTYESRIYFGELETQIEFGERSYTDFLEALEMGETELVFYYVHHFLIHASNVDKHLDALQDSERFRIFQEISEDKSINLKEFRRLRNHLEHYEERLDTWIKRN